MSFDGNSYPSFEGIRLDFTDKNGSVDGYLSLCSDFLFADHGIIPSLDDYESHTYYKFDLGNFPSVDNDHESRLRSADGRLTLRFLESSSNEGLSLLVYTLTDECISISKDRMVEKGFVA